MMTTNVTIYYLCKSEDVHTGIFGNADQCAHWYLTYRGAECRIYPKLRKHDDREGQRIARDVHLDEGHGPVWYVAFKSANNYLFQEAPFTVVGNNEKDAYHALCCHVVQNKLLSTVDSDDEFYMVPAEQALPNIMRRTEMRELYNLAGESGAGEEGDVEKWFCNADHPKESLLRMVDILSNRSRSPFTAVDVDQIRKQITHSVVDEGVLYQHKPVCAPSPQFC